MPWRRLLSFRTCNQPYMVRLSYEYEMRTALTYPLASSLAEGGFTGIVAAKYFAASKVLIAVITAAPMFGNIMAMVWSELSKTRRQIPFVNWLQGGVVTSIALVALTGYLPMGPGGGVAGWTFAALIILARLTASGIVTIRSTIWRENYPREIRGQIVARITVLSTIMLATTTFFGSMWLDHNPRAFVILYPGAAALGAIAIWQFSHIRVRHEGVNLRRTRERVYGGQPDSMAQTGEANVLNYQAPPWKRGLRGFFAETLDVLRHDQAFRIYQRWQFLNGASFMMFGPPLLYMVSREMTNPRKDYLLATIILQIIPMVVCILFTQAWAPLFDRMQIVSFRVLQGWISVVAQVTIFVGAITDHLWLVAVAQALVGISNAGGNLAWNLGHNAFAPPEKTTIYMGVHVMLTGLRGCLAPFVGVALYNVPWIGRGVFAASALTCVISTVGFMSMWKTMPARKPLVRPRPEPATIRR